MTSDLSSEKNANQRTAAEQWPFKHSNLNYQLKFLSSPSHSPLGAPTLVDVISFEFMSLITNALFILFPAIFLSEFNSDSFYCFRLVSSVFLLHCLICH